MEQTAMPNVTLGRYKGLNYTRRVRPVLERTVEQEMISRARNSAVFIPTDAPAARGDRVCLDFAGMRDGAPIPDSEMKDVTVVLGTGQLMPAAEQAVYGHAAGETFQFDFTYPDDFRVPELSGVTAQFRIVLHTVKRRQAMQPDDAFARTQGFADLEALKENIRAKKRASHEANADRIAGAALLDMAGADLTVELPTALLDQNADHDMQQLNAKLARSGITLEQHCSRNHTTPEQLRAEYYRDAERKLRALLAVRAIAEAEHITVSPEEVEAEVARLSKLHDTPEAEIRKVLTPDAIAAAITNQKVQRFLIDHANITSVVEKE